MRLTPCVISGISSAPRWCFALQVKQDALLPTCVYVEHSGCMHRSIGRPLSAIWVKLIGNHVCPRCVRPRCVHPLNQVQEARLALCKARQRVRTSFRPKRKLDSVVELKVGESREHPVARTILDSAPRLPQTVIMLMYPLTPLLYLSSLAYMKGVMVLSVWFCHSDFRIASTSVESSFMHLITPLQRPTTATLCIIDQFMKPPPDFL